MQLDTPLLLSFLNGRNVLYQLLLLSVYALLGMGYVAARVATL